MPNPHQLPYRKLIARLKLFGVIEVQHRGKGSEVVLLKPRYQGSKQGPQATIGHHGDNNAVSPAVINAVLRRLEIDKDTFWSITNK